MRLGVIVSLLLVVITSSLVLSLFNFKEYPLNPDDYLAASYSNTNQDSYGISVITANVVTSINKSQEIIVESQKNFSLAKNNTKGHSGGGGGNGNSGGNGNKPPIEENNDTIVSPPINETVINETNTSNVVPSSLDPLYDGLILYFKFNNQQDFNETVTTVHDFSGNNNVGEVMGGAVWNGSSGINGSGAYQLDGIDDYVTVADSDILSPSTTGKYTVTFWVKFLKTQFVGEGSSNSYINFLGKGAYQNYEFAFRQHNSSNPENRPNRVSAYTFNLNGGLGAGSYFQDVINVGDWMFVSSVYNGTFIDIWKNGVLRDSDPLSEYNITLQNGNAPLNIGTLNQKTFLEGSIDELRVYNRTLNSSEIDNLYSIWI